MTTTGLAFSQTFAYDEAPGYVKRALGSAAVTATAFIGTQLDQGAAALTDMAIIITVEAIDVSSTNETYTFRVVGSNVADRSDGRTLATLYTGIAATPETVAGAAGDRLVAMFRTERDRTAYRYIDLHLTAGGTTPSITFGAYLAPLA